MTSDPRKAARRALEMTLRRTVLLPGWAAVFLLTIICALGVEIPRTLQYVPFALSLPLLGLPHGALDHLVPARLSGRAASARSVLGVVALYAVLASLYLALWFSVPLPAFALFIALTWFHWGQGDLYSLRALLGARQPRTRFQNVLTVLVRGGLPMLVPLLAFPEVYREVARNMVGLFYPEAALDFAWISGTTFPLTVGLLFAALALASLALGRRRAGGISSFVDVAETALLALYFALVPPVLAIGVYFCLWHSLRHIARLMILDGKSARALERGHAAPAFAAFFKGAAPLTFVALAGLAGLYFAVPGGVEGRGSLLALYLTLISVLTLPHVVVVCLMDLRQRVWA